jgi:tetratricopeptide (TPR) repeat protein
LDEAIAYLTRGLEIQETNYDCLIGLSKAYERKNELDKAIQLAHLAIEQPNSNINSVFYLGMLYLKKKDVKNASEQF